MTKLIPQLSFISSNNEAAQIEPNADLKPKNCDEGASLSAAGSKRSALSASDAECFSLCLGAGPLWYVYGPLCVCLCGGPDVPVDSSAPPGGAAGGAARPAAPPSPTHDDNNCDLLSQLLCGGSLSGSAETLLSPQREHPANDGAREAVISKIVEGKERHPVKVDFKIFLTENTASQWEAVVQANTVYLRLPAVLSSGSKESFMVLLDFAEERLGCTNCVVCVRKSRSDRAVLLRTFMFMGFQILPPTSALLPRELNNNEYVFLHYNMQ